MKKSGRYSKFYIGTAGSEPTDLCNNVVDITVTAERSAIDTSTRSSAPFSNNVPDLISLTASIILAWDNTDVHAQALRKAFIEGTPIAGFMSDGNGGGWDADWNVDNLEEGQPLKDKLSYNISLSVNADSRKPQLYNPDATGGTNGTAAGTAA